MNKKFIVMTAGAGLISFGTMFAAAWFTKPQNAGANAAGGAAAGQGANVDGQSPELQSEADTEGLGGLLAESGKSTSMEEKQLKRLVYDIRAKMADYELRQEELSLREDRVKSAQQELDKEVEELSKLRVELASTIVTLKSERAKLEKTLVEITKMEKVNFIGLAATYDKMDAGSASTIFMTMTKGQNATASDAVKILHYMTERTKANVLGELAMTEPVLAAYLSQQLKHVREM